MDELSSLSQAGQAKREAKTSGAGVILGFGALALAGAALLVSQWNKGYRKSTLQVI
jgi:hypothetical protein